VIASVADLAGGSATAPTPVVTAPLPFPSKPSIAVLPFANLSGDPEQEYFADGMVAEITTALSRFRSIFVIASGSGLSFKGKGLSPQEVGRQLGVRYVLEGSVRKAGGRVRISVQLIDAVDGVQLWADRFDDTLEDIFALQDRVALSVAGKVDPTVQQAEIRRASARPTDNMGSYELFLRAMAFIGKRGEAELLAGLDFLNRAIALDPDFGQALAWAAFFEAAIAYFGWTDDVVGRRERALGLADRGLTVAGDDPQVIASSAMVYAMIGRKGAGALLERAIALNPGSSLLWVGRAYLQIQAGEANLAIESVTTCLRLDPVSPHLNDAHLWLGVARFEQGEFEAAVTALREARDVIPTAPAFLAACLGHLGQTGEAREALEHYRRMTQFAIADLARVTLHDPTHRKLFLDGIALAEGKPESPGAKT
jgi:adenylate cyclase